MVLTARREELIHLGLRLLLAVLTVPALLLPASLEGLVQQREATVMPAESKWDSIPFVARPNLGDIPAHNLFRADRRPSTLAYSDKPAIPSMTEAPRSAPKPSLALTGLVGGARLAAVLEGLPGIEGSRVMGVGDSAGGVRVIRITGSTVVLRGYDTLWSLGVRRPW